MIRELPSFLAGIGALLLFGAVLTGARSPAEADQLNPSAAEASAIHVKAHHPAAPAPSLAFNH